LTVTIKESGEGQGGYAKEMSKEFLEAEYALFRAQAKEVDIVITTALIPGKPAPKLWFTDMVELMKPGSVIVDLAAEKGGNCELTQPGEVVEHKGVSIVGYTDLASRMAHVASDMYGTNLAHFLDEMGGAKGYKVDHDNDAIRPALVLEAGEKRWPPPPAKKPDPVKVASAQSSQSGKIPRTSGPTSVAIKAEPARPIAIAPEKSRAHGHGAPAAAPSRASAVVMSVIGLALAATWAYLRFAGNANVMASPATVALLQHLTVFVMAVFVGFQVVWNVTPALHTPLMSVTNAISGIIVVGGLLGSQGRLSTSLGVAVVATLFATINIAGGFLVTRRMLAMFRK
jgi:NAD(P) transhydrogenase subunit alpha